LKIILVVEAYGTASQDQGVSPQFVTGITSVTITAGWPARCHLAPGADRHGNTVTRWPVRCKRRRRRIKGLPTERGEQLVIARGVPFLWFSGQILKKNIIADLISIVGNSAFTFDILMLLYQFCNKSNKVS